MTDDEIRALVREAIAKRAPREAGGRDQHDGAGRHASHARFAVVTGGDADGHCVIEPSVRCVHCGYCQSFGH
jgi:hypothetical protein